MSEFSTAMKDPRAYLKPQDISKMIKAEPDMRNKLIIRLLFRGGMRVSELCGTEVKKILWDEDCIIIPWLKKRREKGKPPPLRMIPLDTKTMNMIREYLEYRKKFHLNGNSPKLIPIGRKMIYWIVRRAAERIGIFEVGSSHPHPHTLRHSHATFRVIETGGDMGKLRSVQLILGHKDIGTTASYLAVSGKELHKGYNEDFAKLED